MVPVLFCKVVNCTNVKMIYCFCLFNDHFVLYGEFRLRKNREPETKGNVDLSASKWFPIKGRSPVIVLKEVAMDVL